VGDNGSVRTWAMPAAPPQRPGRKGEGL